MEKELFGTLPTGENIYKYTVENEFCTLSVMNFGATVTSFKPFGTDIVAGFENFADYFADRSCHAAIVGRVANRIRNAELNIDGAIHMLSANQSGNCLHGGFEGFARKYWTLESSDDKSLIFTYYSPDGEEGFPEGLFTRVKYTLDGASMIIEYEATPDGRTAIALTNHCFFNLNGFGERVYDTKARIYAESYTEVDGNGIPTGRHPSVRGTVYDFTYEKPFGEGFPEGFKGHDVNYNLAPIRFKKFVGKYLGLAAEIYGRALKMSYYTDQPGTQLYLANHVGLESSEPFFVGGKPQLPNSAFCLEAQTEPDCVSLGEAIYDLGEVYRQTTVYCVEKL